MLNIKIKIKLELFLNFKKLTLYIIKVKKSLKREKTFFIYFKKNIKAIIINYI